MNLTARVLGTYPSKTPPPASAEGSLHRKIYRNISRGYFKKMITMLSDNSPGKEEVAQKRVRLTRDLYTESNCSDLVGESVLPNPKGFQVGLFVP